MTVEDFALNAKTYGVVLCLIVFSLFAIWSPRVKGRRLRWCLRVTGGIALLPSLLGLLFLLVFSKYTSVVKLPSPDKRFICYIKGGGSAATDDWTSITLRRAWSPVAQEVYFTEGAFDPQVHWKNAKTLVISYPEHENPELCRQSLAGIDIECCPAPRKEFFPLETPK